jgi:hypothetical protein
MDQNDASGWSPELGVLRVAAPCKADWNAMQGNEQVRYCSDCKLNVYNLAGMSPEAARAVVRASEGGALCMRFYQRPDGTLTVAQCPPGLSARARRRWAMVTASGTAALALVLLGVELRRPSDEAPVSPLRPVAPSALAVESKPPRQSDDGWIEERRKLLGGGPAPSERKRVFTTGVIRGTPSQEPVAPTSAPNGKGS